MKKQIKRDIIYEKYFDGSPRIRFSDLPSELLEDDIIDIQRIDPYYSEDNSWDEHTILTILRERGETDAEYELRLEKEKKRKAESNQRQYEQYLLLKSKFESTGSASN